METAHPIVTAAAASVNPTLLPAFDFLIPIS
jgi:hypothetical protein